MVRSGTDELDLAALIVISVASIGAFLVVFWLVGVVSVARDAIATTRVALRAMRDPALDEVMRERTVQKAAISLMIAAGSIILRSAVALAAAFVPIFFGDCAGIAPTAATLAFMERWDVILIASLLVTFGYVLYVRVWTR